MSTPQVTTHTEGEVFVVTLNRPEVRNAVDRATAQALHAAFVAFEADTATKVAVLYGDHGHFCAGWDLQSGAQTDEAATAELIASLEFTAADAQPSGPMGPSRLQLSKPVIAAIAGAAVAGGMELALWCDLRVMEEDAYLGVYCRRFGVPLIDGGTVRLPRLIGMGRALDLILTGRQVKAQEAAAIGLASRVVAVGEALRAALSLAHSLCAFPQDTLLADRKSAYAQWDLCTQQALLQEWESGKACIAEGIKGAQRFAAGAGRHGRF